MKHTFKPCHGGCELKRFFVILIALVMCIAATVSAAESATAKLSELYAEAELLLVEGSYDEAAAKFDALGSYSDASKMAMYCKAISMAETYKMYTIAVDTLLKLGEFKDCEQLAVYYTGRGTEDAGDIVLDNIDKASDDDIKKAIKCYEDADKMYTELMLFKDSMIRAAQVAGKKKQLEEEQEIRSGNSKENAYLTAKAFEEQSKWDEAIATYETIKDYKDSSDRIDFCALAQKKEHYEIGIALLEEKKWDDALVQFTAASDYEIRYNKLRKFQIL